MIDGVMILNDITAGNLQYRGTQWLMGKAVDASTPTGPARSLSTKSRSAGAYIRTT
ncbi:fumarylacetoacetate hydrolase family protein [Pseudarthrobacter oxydans]|uniref:fumarylacetoacetate hydrolase family protein n=1 Tax=Pseudarthrobacter oxydans TaxID=1671 RepID=UPI003D29FC30